MLIILPEPLSNGDHDILSINLNVSDTISVRRLHASFQLIAHKYFDGRFAVDSTIVFVLGNLPTREQCEELLQSIFDALQEGKKIFHIGKYLDSKNKNDPAYN